MKYLYTILLALFPFLHNERYEVTLQSCEQEEIVFLYESEPFHASLFNLNMIDEKGWSETCSILKNAKHIQIEVDTSSAIKDPLPVYVFVDNELLQERLIREDYAYTLIHNPEYTYEKKLMELQASKEVMASSQEQEVEYPYPAQGWMFLFFICICWLSMLVHMIYKKKKVSMKKH